MHIDGCDTIDEVKWAEVRLWDGASPEFVKKEQSSNDQQVALKPTTISQKSLLRAARYNNAAMHERYNLLQKEETRELSPIPIGILAEKWQFPSDHLPVSVRVNGHEIVTWNVMNSVYMHWVTEKNSQGLNGSMITDLDTPVPGKGQLTHRENLIIEMLLDMIGNQDSPKSLIALQEVGSVFLKELMLQIKERDLPFSCLGSQDPNVADQNVILWNCDMFEYKPEESSVTNPFTTSDPTREAQDVMFSSKVDGLFYRVLNAHLPGNPDCSSKEEWAHAYLSRSQPNAINIGLGDFNFEPHEMDRALANEFEKAGHVNKTIERVSPYRTAPGIVPNVTSKAIDHVFVSAEDAELFTVNAVDPEELLAKRFGLKEAIDLFSGIGIK